MLSDRVSTILSGLKLGLNVHFHEGVRLKIL